MESSEDRRNAALRSMERHVREEDWGGPTKSGGGGWDSVQEAWDAVTYGEFGLDLFQRALNRIDIRLQDERDWRRFVIR